MCAVHVVQVVWKKFVKDVEATISKEKSAEDVLFEMQMEEGIKSLDRQQEQTAFKIDDPQMRHVKENTILDGLAKIPRPWELGYDQWAKSMKPDMDEVTPCATRAYAHTHTHSYILTLTHSLTTASSAGIRIEEEG